ncbi:MULTISPECIES: hypothetical protein [Corallococcus]|uniref:hypothetical protein n=1 Tax=Corallococcus TaxID=83461 RepID=UPI00117EDEB8|nr:MULTISPECIES: hypothetical protein [Corallococcus]NBD08904.1 hypothetical protein [Corallococcus silvisoli]TSC32850.1 hypothetical protein FOF48_07575 [Corallococcus sp. Z5C101001]
MKKTALLTCLLGLLGAALPASAAELKDVFGKEVPIGQGRPTLVLYANKGTRDELRQRAYQFIYDVRAQRPIVVVHVDLRDVPGLFKGMARGEIRKGHDESLNAMKDLFREKGEAPPPELDSSLYMVADSKGEPHESMGLKKGFDRVFAQVLDNSGQEVARGPLSDGTRRFSQALTAPTATGVASRLPVASRVR